MAEMFTLEDHHFASAIHYLIEGNEVDAAKILLSCSAGEIIQGDWQTPTDLYLRCPRGTHDVFVEEENPLTQSVRQAFCAIFRGTLLAPDRIIPQAEMITDLSPNWRDELLEAARSGGISNQAKSQTAIHVWNNLRFRSKTEIKIAEELERQKVLFLPNCMARLGISTGRFNRETDFLICLKSKWGILEVDGEPFHPPSRAAEDHERDRVFKEHGIKVVEHFDAVECYQHPDVVVRKFLGLLQNI